MFTESRKSTSWINAEMKTSMLVLLVVAVHGALVGSLLFVGGCGRKTTAPSAPVVAPEATVPMPMPQTVAEHPAPDKMPKSAKGPGVVAPPESGARASFTPAPLAKPSDTHEYVVQSGDMLASIAKRSNTTTAEIMALNKISNPNKIFVGQKLLIPGKTTKASEKKASAKKASKPAVKQAEPASGSGEYTVQAGDVLGRIAKKFGVKSADIKEANGLKSDAIRVGQKLKIPSAVKAETAAPATAAAVAEPAPVEGVSAPAPAPAEPAPAAPVPVAEPAPADVAAPADTAANAVAPAPAAGSELIHVVLEGQDLGVIAKLYSVKIESLAQINNLTPGTVLSPGQKLRIPESH